MVPVSLIEFKRYVNGGCMGLRSWLYRLASLMGDVNAVRRGPEAILKRVARKSATRQASQLINKLLR